MIILAVGVAWWRNRWALI